jgi:hypothetical protein
MNKTDAMCNLITAYMLGRGGDVQHREIGDMVRKIVPDEGEIFGRYIQHLYNRGTVQRVERGTYRLSTPEEVRVTLDSSLQNPTPSDLDPIHSVYWLHHPEHTDPFTQGYVGITKRKNREKQHRNSRRIPADFIFTVLAENLTRFEAAKMEWEHRKQRNIGWNIKMGGGKFIRSLLEAQTADNEIVLARTPGGSALVFHPHGDPHGRDL